MSEIEFKNHAGMEIKYPISVSVSGRQTIYTATSDTRQKYTAYIEKWDDGWAAMEVSDTGTGAFIAEGCASKYEAAR